MADLRDLLNTDIKLKGESLDLFNAIRRMLRRIMIYNGAFIIIALAVIVYFFSRRPAEVSWGIKKMEMKIEEMENKTEALRQEAEKFRRIKDSAQIERYRLEAAKAELLQIENKYK